MAKPLFSYLARWWMSLLPDLESDRGGGRRRFSLSMVETTPRFELSFVLADRLSLTEPDRGLPLATRDELDYYFFPGTISLKAGALQLLFDNTPVLAFGRSLYEALPSLRAARDWEYGFPEGEGGIRVVPTGANELSVTCAFVEQRAQVAVPSSDFFHEVTRLYGAILQEIAHRCPEARANPILRAWFSDNEADRGSC